MRMTGRDRSTRFLGLRCEHVVRQIFRLLGRLRDLGFGGRWIGSLRLDDRLGGLGLGDGGVDFGIAAGLGASGLETGGFAFGSTTGLVASGLGAGVPEFGIAAGLGASGLGAGGLGLASWPSWGPRPWRRTDWKPWAQRPAWASALTADGLEALGQRPAWGPAAGFGIAAGLGLSGLMAGGLEALDSTTGLGASGLATGGADFGIAAGLGASGLETGGFAFGSTTGLVASGLGAGGADFGMGPAWWPRAWGPVYLCSGRRPAWRPRVLRPGRRSGHCGRLGGLELGCRRIGLRCRTRSRSDGLGLDDAHSGREPSGPEDPTRTSRPGSSRPDRDSAIRPESRNRARRGGTSRCRRAARSPWSASRHRDPCRRRRPGDP